MTSPRPSPSDGSYRLANVTGGIYRIKFTAAGFTDVWYRTGDVRGGHGRLVAGTANPLDAQLVGQPAGVTGRVNGDDLTGTSCAHRPRPAAGPPRTDDHRRRPAASTAATGPVVQTVAVDSAGGYIVTGLPTPSEYNLTATKAGFVSRPRVVNVQPGRDHRHRPRPAEG